MLKIIDKNYDTRSIGQTAENQQGCGFESVNQIIENYGTCILWFMTIFKNR